MYFSEKQKQGLNLSKHSHRKSEDEVKGSVGGGGYIKEFVDTVWKPNMKKILQDKIKVVTNAGGLQKTTN